jgi:hypothetical protein
MKWPDWAITLAHKWHSIATALHCPTLAATSTRRRSWKLCSSLTKNMITSSLSR